MVRRGLARSLVIGLAALAAAGCKSSETPSGDGGLDATVSDATASDVATALGLDFVATGCATGNSARTDGGVARCTGTAPLTLTFSPVGSATLTRYRWTFGDGTSPSSERAPTHTYVLPGLYDVTVAAEGSSGSVSRQRSKFVEVTPNAAGQPCNIDGQCAAGLACLCGEGAPCGDGFTHGICTRACPADGCKPGAACARVPLPAPPAGATDAGAADVPISAYSADAEADAQADADVDAPASFDAATADADAVMRDAADADGGAAGGDADAAARDAAATDGDADAGAAAPTPGLLCIGTCTKDADCGDGLVCSPLPGQAPGSWVSVCVPASLRRVGEPCRNARGQLDDGLCASGQCADLGALGLCSATCAGGVACPPGAACATFGDGRALCVAACSASSSSSPSCTRDPLLACETGLGGGALGFAIAPPMPGAKFCAPRSCSSQADCSPSGTCKPLGVGAHCVAN
jgi:PKD repeat protein